MILRRVIVPQLDVDAVLALLEGLPQGHSPTAWAEADGWSSPAAPPGMPHDGGSGADGRQQQDPPGETHAHHAGEDREGNGNEECLPQATPTKVSHPNPEPPQVWRMEYYVRLQVLCQA